MLSVLERLANLKTLLEMIVPIPESWKGEAKARKGKTNEIEQLPCKDYKTLELACRKAMHWTPGLDCALSVMLAVITSTKIVGDQLWVKIIGPASCGKSTLCEAVSANREYVLAKSKIKGFHSGYQSDREGDEDNSLIVLVNGKTLVTKDGDTLLQMSNLGEILAEGRDLYDRTSRNHYRNKTSREYTGISMSWILCGTNALRQLDASELGARFLDCVIMEGIDDDIEDDILWRVANRADRNMSIESDGTPESQQDAETTKMMQLCAGYITHLRQNAPELLSKVTIGDTEKRHCTRLGKFTAYMRARPSSKQDEVAEREFAARLVSQHVRLAKCLAAVLNRKTVDEEVLAIVKKVAMDTSRGQTLEIARHLYFATKGFDLYTLSHFLNRTEAQVRIMLRFLQRIGVVENFQTVSTQKIRSKVKWRLTKSLRNLYFAASGDKVEENIDA